MININNKKPIKLFNDDNLILNEHYSFSKKNNTRKLIKSKERVQDHGEVFTPKWMVKKMLSYPQIYEKVKDIDATFFEPSAGEGAFLIELLKMRLDYVSKIANKQDWKEKATRSLMSVYAIEYLEDNLIVARNCILKVIVEYYEFFYQKKLKANTDFYKNCIFLIKKNIVQGDTLSYKNSKDDYIEFNHWIIQNGLVLRKPFLFKSMFGDNYVEKDNLMSNAQQLSLFDDHPRKKSYKLSKITKLYKEEIE